MLHTSHFESDAYHQQSVQAQDHNCSFLLIVQEYISQIKLYYFWVFLPGLLILLWGAFSAYLKQESLKKQDVQFF